MFSFGGPLVAPRSRERMDSSASQSDILMHATAPEPDVLRDPQLRDVVPFVAGNRTFAVFAVHVEGTAEAKMPAALPRAQADVLGVVCVSGRMLSVLGTL